ncbi:hypothetical protein DDB_G0279133 [Dictyostelium discoideum AX4]|uniref:Probable syntaxin-7B n=1 Tax=Dictyostelium discoideum TaxID=44689 RepID=STX7B_DICDI|nr:hypothetical protein DDB_G0279133 [Dictyostelium discoideum AX4]Q54X86.1 RecName: Full=Probable syntaxin-7B [Dictyostelium discoideum]EAL67866.1 hypothetical protein DDB_G0279133 [Dictyostelium discoideum AX4]|eukprot:XP_641842.1 hypothetical protein DDB_G0279133 [Dictyostelium discoideum AX4]
MTDRQPLISKNDDIINNLTRFYTELTEFEKIIKDVGTGRDTTTLRSTLHKKKVNLADDLKVIAQQIKQLPSSKLPKFQQEKIVKQFKEASSKFEELLSTSNKKESSHEPIVPSQQQQQQQNNGNSNNNGYNTRGGYNQQQQQQQQQYNDYTNNNNNNNNNEVEQYNRLEQALKSGIEQDEEEYTNRILDERNANARQIARDVAMLKEAMDDIAVMVGEQGEMLEKVDDNVTNADVAVEDAVVELEKAYVYKSSYRKKMIIFVICLLVTLVAVGIFLAIYYGVIKKK